MENKMPRYIVSVTTYWSIYLIDTKARKDGWSGIVAVFPTVGGHIATGQIRKTALREAKKIAKLLNGA